MREEEGEGGMKRGREIQKKLERGRRGVGCVRAHRRKRRCSDGACSECYISEIWSEECEKSRESGEQRAETEEWKPLPPSLPPSPGFSHLCELLLEKRYFVELTPV